ncbi:hypothetical protein [Fastidiosibacter lacustris]|uniref:hypothetical protein n=1 Tax=Fastidiosibacter lacustris TaxID=2056695 RepID=UPI000E35623C|nr:hypothetical protein [Fastidiosibacter lacustris]
MTIKCIKQSLETKKEKNQLKYSIKTSFICLLAGLVGVTNVSYAENITDNTDIQIPTNYTLHNTALDRDLDKKITQESYHKNTLDNLLSSDKGFLWLRSTEGKNWLTSHVGQNWFRSDSSIVNEWLNTEDAKSWALTPEGEETLFLKVQSLSDNKQLTYHNRLEWPSFTNIGVHAVVIGAGIVGYKNVANRAVTTTALAIVGLATANIGQWAINSSTSFQSPLDKVLITKAGQAWLYTESGVQWLLSPSGLKWLESSEGQDRLSFLEGNKNGHSIARDIIHSKNLNAIDQVAKKMEKVLLEKVKNANTIAGYWYASDLDQFLSSYLGGLWLASDTGIEWLKSYEGKEWQVNEQGEMRKVFINWLNTNAGLQSIKNESILQDFILGYVNIMDNSDSKNWYAHSDFSKFILSKAGGVWLATEVGQQWMKTSKWGEWLTQNAYNTWLWENTAITWLNSSAAKEWVQKDAGKKQFQDLLNSKGCGQEDNRHFIQKVYSSDCVVLQRTLAGKTYNTQLQ